MKWDIVGEEVDKVAESERVYANDGSKEKEDREKGELGRKEEEEVAEKKDCDERDGPQRVGEKQSRLGAGEREREERRWNEGSSLDGQSGWKG